MVGYSEVNAARNLILSLEESLKQIYARDADEEISEYAYWPIDEALKLAARHVGDHPVVRRIRELFSPEAIAQGGGLRVAEVLPVVALLRSILTTRTGELMPPPEDPPYWANE